VPDLDEKAIGLSDLGLRGIHLEIESVKGSAAGAAHGPALGHITAQTGVHDALPGGLMDGTIIEEPLRPAETLANRNRAIYGIS